MLLRLDICLQDSHVVAVGECGLDRLHGPELNTQQHLFFDQVRLSEKYGKPMILHVVRCHEEILNARKQLRPQMPWIIHGFRSNLEIARKYVQSGCLISFGKALLMEKQNQSVFLSVPPEAVFLETDTSRTDIREIYAWAEHLRPGISIQILQNAARIFPDVMSGI